MSITWCLRKRCDVAMTGRILIVDDMASSRSILKLKLASARYDMAEAENGRDALDKARQFRPDLILLDLMLPDLHGTEVCRRLRADPATADIPVIVVTGLSDPASRCDALRAGADDVMAKPADILMLLARMRSLLRAREIDADLGRRSRSMLEHGLAEPPPPPFETRPRIAVVAAPDSAERGWPSRLGPRLGADAQVVAPECALDLWANGTGLDLVIVATGNDPRSDGLLLMSELRARSAARAAPVCVLVPPEAREVAAMALDLGASDVLWSDYTPEEVSLRLARLNARRQQIERQRATLEAGLRLAVTDELTGLYNRRYAQSALDRTAAAARTSGRAFAVILLDVDRFKSVNDSHGHAAGDAVLCELAARLRDNLRTIDIIARMGGEEFLVALPDCTLDDARATAERLRRVVAERSFLLNPGGPVEVTISAGLAISRTPPAPAETLPELLERADRALLTAKAQGRNQVTIARTAA
jgi:two-component system cell cycle response regulator